MPFSMFRQSCSIRCHRSRNNCWRSGVLRPRNLSGTGTRFARRAASNFWPKNQPTRVSCAVSKTSLSRASGITRSGMAQARLCNITQRVREERERPMPRFRTLDDLEVRGKRVLFRADLNVPVKDGKVTDATRIERLAPTIRELAEKGARVIVMSHFGRPENGRDPKLSLRPLAEPLAKAVGRPVAFAEDCIGEAARRVVDGLKDGDIALLENTRFHPEEEKNDPGFTKQLAALGDVYVNDAFS